MVLWVKNVVRLHLNDKPHTTELESVLTCHTGKPCHYIVLFDISSIQLDPIKYLVIV